MTTADAHGPGMTGCGGRQKDEEMESLYGLAMRCSHLVVFRGLRIDGGRPKGSDRSGTVMESLSTVVVRAVA